jgi:hypothetical protein
MDFTRPEQLFLAAVETGSPIDLRLDRSGPDSSKGAMADSDRTIRAEILADLLTRKAPSDSRQLQAVRLAGARVSGVLNLREATVMSRLGLDSVDVSVHCGQLTFRIAGWCGGHRVVGRCRSRRCRR